MSMYFHFQSIDILGVFKRGEPHFCNSVCMGLCGCRLQLYACIADLSYNIFFCFGLHVGIILIHGESIPTLTRKKRKKGRSE